MNDRERYAIEREIENLEATAMLGEMVLNWPEIATNTAKRLRVLLARDLDSKLYSFKPKIKPRAQHYSKGIQRPLKPYITNSFTAKKGNGGIDEDE